MKCWNCNTEMKKFPNMRGLRQIEPMIVLDDDYEENGSLFGGYDTLANSVEYEKEYTTFFGKKKKTTEEETHYINPVYNICPNCGLIAKFVDKKDMEKLFPKEDTNL